MTGQTRFLLALVAFVIALALAAYALGRWPHTTLCDAIKDAHGCPSPTVTVTR